MNDEVLETIEETQLSRRGLLVSGGLAAAGLTALGRPASAAYGAATASIKVAVGFGAMILVLILRPQGLFARASGK